MNSEVAAPFIPYGRHSLNEADIEAVTDVLRKGPLTQGPWVEAFEKDVAAYVGARYAVAVSSGTAGLHLACLAAGLGPGDVALTTPNTFVATSNGVVYAGAEPQFIDIHPQTLNLDPARLSETFSRTKRIKAILPVHFAGLPCDMPAIHEQAKKHGAVVIEDAAHALGAAYPQGGRVGNGTWSDMTVFSFHPVKLIAAGEGGMITTNREDLYRRLLRLRSHGINKMDDPFQIPEQAFTGKEPNPWYYEMQELGFNYRITDLQAALASAQLKRIEAFLSRRREIAQRYDSAFSGLKFVSQTQTPGRALSAHHLYVVRIPFQSLGLTRQGVMKALQSKGVGSQVHYIPVYRHPYYARKGITPAAFPKSEAYYAEALTLPMFYDLGDEDQTRVIDAVQAALA